MKKKKNKAEYLADHALGVAESVHKEDFSL